MGTRYGLEIRAAAASDAPGLAALLAEAGLAVSVADLAGRLDALGQAGGTALLAVEWGPPSGLIALNPCPTLAARPFGLITLLLVAPDARRRGIGRVLLKAAARAARQAACDRLVLHPGPPDLHAFAASTGFAPDADGLLVRPLLRRGSAEG
ncbi:GNAT family N-acetyltransferase [Methylobacterium sp. NEAU 140]|uniref:GNAT family N-acetyltransferase n=1 Tax=Methylobacterium sp. NEAU 140 TaxID=3064945 RepID=UPI0027361261|nr:GNAT family N-acetyltransferase [Methylobacterium sp. NEAU 140]MDP4023661.1 GNAT family N-acetyltransferase [Methylobacterium sp. NEAU 140]